MEKSNASRKERVSPSDGGRKYRIRSGSIAEIALHSLFSCLWWAVLVGAVLLVY